MKLYFNLVKEMAKSKKGQGMVEYGLIIALIAVAVIGALVLLGPQIASLFSNVTNTISGT